MSPVMTPAGARRVLFHELRYGPPVDRLWIWWHLMIGAGAGVFILPGAGPLLIVEVVLFLWAAVMGVVGVCIHSRALVSRGLLLMAVASAVRSVVIWNTRNPLGPSLIAIFLWSMIAIGAVMEGAAVKHRGWAVPPDATPLA